MVVDKVTKGHESCEMLSWPSFFWHSVIMYKKPAWRHFTKQTLTFQATSARGSAALKPLAQSTKPSWARLDRPIGLCKLSPTAPVLSRAEGSAPGEVAMESQPLLRETALGRALNLPTIGIHVNDRAFHAGLFGGEGQQVAFQRSAG